MEKVSTRTSQRRKPDPQCWQFYTDPRTEERFLSLLRQDSLFQHRDCVPSCEYQHPDPVSQVWQWKRGFDWKVEIKRILSCLRLRLVFLNSTATTNTEKQILDALIRSSKQCKLWTCLCWPEPKMLSNNVLQIAFMSNIWGLWLRSFPPGSASLRNQLSCSFASKNILIMKAGYNYRIFIKVSKQR